MAEPFAGTYGCPRTDSSRIRERAEQAIPLTVPPKDVSRWLNSGNKASAGTIGFPKYETMTMIADFFGVDVGYLTGETDETSFDLEHASACWE